MPGTPQLAAAQYPDDFIVLTVSIPTLTPSTSVGYHIFIADRTYAVDSIVVRADANASTDVSLIRAGTAEDIGGGGGTALALVSLASAGNRTVEGTINSAENVVEKNQVLGLKFSAAVATAGLLVQIRLRSRIA